MKTLNQTELQNLVDYMQGLLLGAQLQEIQSNDRGLALGFQGEARYWLILDLIPAHPMMLLFENHCPFKKAAKTKPAALFLNSHGKNLQVSDVKILAEWGRVVLLSLESRDQELKCELEIRLIPKQANLIVKTQQKSISWEKPLPLSPPPQVDVPEARSLAEIQKIWLEEQKGSKKSALDPVAQFEKQKNKDLEKKRKALIDIQKQIDSVEADQWRHVGQALKVQGSLDIEPSWEKYLDRKESLSWNIENCFSKSKQLENKKQGARERQTTLAKEILALEKKNFSESLKKPSLNDLMQKTEARGRKMQLESGAIAYCGRSGADNLKLLRQAKAWDYWLHLKDYPGAHAILHRQRDQEIPEKEIQQVAEWVAKESLSAKSIQNIGKLSLVIVECRFVRPIKGDKLGRVTFHSEKSFSFTLRHD